jgi:uncharacterized membrane protein YqaE (UPF0057 family)
MKKIIAFAALAILVSSCGNKMTLMKRHYTKGFYLHHSAQVKQQDQAFSEKIKTDKMPTLKTYVSEQTAERSVVAMATAPAETGKSSCSLQHNLAQKVNEINPVAVKTQGHTFERKFPAFKQVESKNTSAAGGDANTIVEIILCLLIPPLAVFVHEDSITSHFWIDLLLCFLFFLPGVIYAFVICFA